MSPSIEYTDSKQTSLGRSGTSVPSLRSRSAGSLWRKMCFSTRPRRIPSIMDAWFFSSDRMAQPGSSWATVLMAASLATYPELNRRAASFWCRSASSRSRSTWKWLVPAMLRVPPAPAPTRPSASTIAPRTAGCWPIPR